LVVIAAYGFFVAIFSLMELIGFYPITGVQFKHV
jgi:hypothetical protein